MALVQGQRGNMQVKALRMIDELSDKTSPNNPFNPERALSGRPQSIYRIKKARLRTRYSGSSGLGTIDVLLSMSTSR